VQIMCLISQKVREAAQGRDACGVLLAKLEADVEEGTLAGACLDTLLALLANSPANQQDFAAQAGLVRVSQLLPEMHSCQYFCKKSAQLCGMTLWLALAWTPCWPY